MGLYSPVPKRAELLDRIEGKITAPEGKQPHGNDGKHAVVSMYRVPLNYADGGAIYLAIKVDDEQRRIYRYTNKNVAHATRQFQEMRAILGAV